jgi:phosphate transport system substrate-binding protein
VREQTAIRRRAVSRGRAARCLAAAASALLVPGLLGAAGGRAAAAPQSGLTLITGSGSSLAANAINEWIANVAQQGVEVVFTADGSAAGLQDCQQATYDFAVSDVGYATGYVPQRPYVYLPILAVATSFPDNIRVAGHRIRNLRLSGQVLAKIFTNHIRNWDNPAITADNNGHALPDLPITTVVPSVASGPSGTTATFTGYLADEFPQLWQSFNQGRSVRLTCGPGRAAIRSQPAGRRRS